MSSSSDESSYGGGPSNVSKFPLHDVCDSPNDDVEQLKKYLFLKPPSQSGKKVNGFGFDDSDDSDDDNNNNNNNAASSPSPTDDPNVFMLSPYINTRDDDENTPLHLAILRGNVKIVQTLLSVAQSDPDNINITKRCDGSFPIHCVLSLSGMDSTDAKCCDILEALASHPHFDHNLKDDSGHTAIMLACMNGSVPVLRKLLSIVKDKSDGIVERVVEGINARGHRTGLRPLHAAAKIGSLSIIKVLLEGTESSTLDIDFNVTDAFGNTPLHAAALSGAWDVAHFLVSNGADPEKKNKMGKTPSSVALRKGITPPPSAFDSSKPPPNPFTFSSKTKVLCHSICSSHFSCPPIIRGGTEPPPENVRRLHVLINKENGTLRTKEFNGEGDGEGDVIWEEECRRADIADVLRVHDYAYVEKISKICLSLPDAPTIAQVDPDTAVSRWSFEAALHAAGSLTEAVDSVMNGESRNAFCAVRPPGHHAGPRGVVTCENDESGSHGFCLLNNVAIGAAYARNVWRSKIKKVAIIDFDVHHGNGTEACVTALLPSQVTTRTQTPFATLTSVDKTYHPWLNEQDIDNVFFTSTHGYGGRDNRVPANIGGWFYPASGVSGATANITDPEEVGKIKADTSTFLLSQSWARMGAQFRECCKIINCGLPLPGPDAIPGMQRIEMRDTYRNNIFPALLDFDPDIIFISAGFDAHAKDSMNFGYVGMVEEDYEWVTRRIVEIANTCCEGRVVSCLEGGYKIHGKMVSPFARSVAAHLRGLTDGSKLNRGKYDEDEVAWEGRQERDMVEARERKKKEALEKQREEARRSLIEMYAKQQREAAVVGIPAGGVGEGDKMEVEGVGGGSVAVSGVNSGGGGGSESPRRKRQKVDYSKLNEEIAKEEKEEKEVSKEGEQKE